MNGECLCSEVQFEIQGDLPNLYQCHCSLCRKATGSAANAATFVHQQNFRWLSGEDRITSFQKPTGYRSDFCSVCGSPVPNQLRGTELVWVPAGLLEAFEAEVNVHLHLGSSASWERDSIDCLRLEAGPESLDALKQALHSTEA
ncbi:GFA family protein [Marinobacter pelagius]|uniref:GFA family protein n=1 Tax=Marinobacter sp. C7 TaxID=2951363 RepID=UPI001EF1600B|nr:GFA family protein [Marinobacter sp. C7]MCG7199854.1 GFA family protein [Marinobacter sp. C7]